jgi:hypothetical protein
MSPAARLGNRSEAHETWRRRELFLRSIEKMRRVIPGVTLRTSFIVGFPGETEEEFEELCGFVKEASFDWMGAFGYSDQEGAGAFDHDQKLSTREIESRRKTLMSIQKKISRSKKKKLMGANSICCWKALRPSPICCSKAAPPCTPQKLTAKFSSTIIPKEWSRKRESFIAAASRRRTITIWWRKSFKARGKR